MEIEVRGGAATRCPTARVGKVHVRGPASMHGYSFAMPRRPPPASSRTMARPRRYGFCRRYIFIVGRAKDMIIINGKNHWPQTRVGGRPIAWVQGRGHCRIRDHRAERRGDPLPCCPLPRLRRCRARPPCATDPRGIRSSPASRRSSSWSRRAPAAHQLGQLARSKARNLYLAGEIQPYPIPPELRGGITWLPPRRARL